MLKRIPQAMLAAIRAFRVSLKPEPIRPVRPAWDDGTNYDVPTFLRRSVTQSW